MECPNCHHEASATALVKCSHCGKAYERQLLEEYEHIGYLLEWLEKHQEELGKNVSVLKTGLVNRETELEHLMRVGETPTQAAKPAVETATPTIAPQPKAPAVEPAPQLPLTPKAAIPAAPATPKPAPAPIPLQASTPVAAAVSAPLPQAAPAKPAPRPAPVPPKPAQPPIEWGKLWDNAVNFVVSGALLRALLYMGAFMIVISAAVLVISFWNSFHPYLRIAFVFAVPAVCYAGGWFIRTRVKLIQAGRVITGIGALLLAVDFAALYQLAQLNIDINLYWLFAALVTTGVYIFTAHRIEGEFFDYLMLLGGVNTLVALTRALNLSLEGSIAAIVLAGAGMAALAVGLWPRGESWRDTARAARYLPQIITPLGLVATLLVDRSSIHTSSMLAFLFAAITYGLLTWKFASSWQLLMMLVSLTAAVGFGVWIFDLTALWLSTAGAILSALYILAGWRFFGERSQFEQKHNYQRVFYATGFLLSLPVLAGCLLIAFMGKTLEAAIPLTLLSLSFCIWSLLLRQPFYGYQGAGLLLASFWMWLGLAKIQLDYFPLAYLLLISFVYVPASIRMGRIDKKFARPFDLTGWLISLGIFFTAFLLGPRTPVSLSGLTLSLLAAYYTFNAWHMRSAVFTWAAAIVLPLSVLQWLRELALPIEQPALVWASLAFAYMLIERLLNRRKDQVWATLTFRMPFALGTILLALVGWFASFNAYIGLYQDLARVPYTLIAQGMIVVLTILAARFYRSRVPLFIEIFLSALLTTFFFRSYGTSLFAHSLDWVHYGLVFGGLAAIHWLVAAALDRQPTRYSHALYTGGYGLAGVAVAWTLFDLPSLLWTLGSFIAMMVASAMLVEFKAHHTWNDLTHLLARPETVTARIIHGAFLWPAAWLLPAWCGLLLIQLDVALAFRWLAFSVPALVYLPLGTWLAKRESSYVWPLSSAAHAFTAVALLFSMDRVLAASGSVISGLNLQQISAADLQAFIAQTLVQLATVVFYSAWARMKSQRFFAHVAAWVSMLLFTSGVLIVLPALTAQIMVVAWAAWAAALMLIGFGLDRLPEGSARHAHGPYFAGYALATFALLVSTQERWLSIIVLGIFILLMSLSAVAVHYRQHRTWDDVVRIFGSHETMTARVVRSAFLWPVAWLFPIWCGLILIQLEVQVAFRWLAFSIPALLYLLLGTWLAKREVAYSWPFSAAAQLFGLVALFASINRVIAIGWGVAGGLSAPHISASDLLETIGQGLVLGTVVAFHAAWAGVKRQRFFAYVAAALSILPFTSFMACLPGISAQAIVISWAAWAAILMLVGLLLDRSKPDTLRHAHGPTPVAYALATFALLVSIQDIWLNILVLGLCILLAAWASLALHFGYQRSWDDFVNFFWRKDTLVRRGARLLPLFFAAYALPVWLMQLEVHYNLSLAWRGVSLALLAPLYIACGLALRRANRDYTWPFYSAGYPLTALGAMIAFDDQRLAIYVLILDIVVYAVSALIFRQPFWLYLATCLTPVTVLVALQYNQRLSSEWVAWIYTALGLAYFGLGQLVERRKPEPGGVAPFAMPLYLPGYLLSAVALALASGDRSLALRVYPANLVLFALSAWRFREPLFLYPTTWLSIVPYYLFAITYFTIPSEWQGLVWLPLIVLLIGLGRFVFHKRPLDLKTPRAILNALAHPAIPFYSIAYALTVNMVLASRWNPTTLTVALAIATLLYLASALLFRHPAWLYPTLFTAHFAILAYFTIHPSDSPARYVTIPFLILTWLEALAGYFVSRRYPVTEMTANGRLVFKFFGREIDFGSYPSVGYLTVPSWAQPIFVVVALDTLLWEGSALSSLDTGLWVSAGFFLLFALFTTLWQDKLLAHVSLGLGILAIVYQMYNLGLATPGIFANLGIIALGLYLLSWLADWLKGRLEAWQSPLSNLAIELSVISLLVTLPLITGETLSAALALAAAGGLYLTMSLRRRTTLIGYFGMGMLLAGWSLFLFFAHVEQPQFYAIPAGLYFTGMGFFERRRRPGRFALLIESLGLAFLLVTSFIQSMDAITGLPYFLLLLVEGGLVVWWGAARRLRVPFVIGLIAIVVNFLAQLVVRFHDANPWVIGFVVGIALVTLGIFVERRREKLLAQAQDFRDMLERWE